MLTNPVELSNYQLNDFVRLSHAAYRIQCCFDCDDNRLELGTFGGGMNRQPGQCPGRSPGSYSVSDQQPNLIIPLRESVHMARPKNFRAKRTLQLPLWQMALRRFVGAGNDSLCITSSPQNPFVIVLAILTTQPFPCCSRCTAFI